VDNLACDVENSNLCGKGPATFLWADKKPLSATKTSYEKGTVENTAGLVRRFFPKQTDFAKISKNEVKAVENWLNQRPRKCLGFKTPASVFKNHCVALRT